MAHRRRRFVLALAGAAALGVGLSPLAGLASSHREAPLIAEDPVADNTDLYAFVSPDNTDTVTIVANYIPFEQPASGPNFHRFGDDVLYQIHVDNVGDGLSHLTFNLRFQTDTVNKHTFLYNTGPITWNAAKHRYDNWNRPQSYTLTMTKDGDTTTLGDDLLTPPDVVGSASTGNAATYHALAQHAVHTLNTSGGTVTVFAGQRDDPFFADLGGIFDLLNLPAFGSPGQDYVAGLNVHSIVLRVPKSMLQGPNPNDPVVGFWASASRHKTTVLNGNGTKDEDGPWVQVSRLGNPLVNEVVTDLGTKDLFNATQPKDDSQFAGHFLKPELAALIKAIFGTPTPTTNRTDLVAVLLTGLPGLNKSAPANPTLADELRLNMAIAPSSTNPNSINRLGVLGGQLDGYPNGRRLADDVVDIEVQAIAGATAGVAIPSVVGDGVNSNDVPFLTSFPYVADPHQP
jgi:Domain of unknown function (DUF4331)